MQILPVKKIVKRTIVTVVHRFFYRKSFYSINSKAKTILFETRFIFVYENQKKEREKYIEMGSTNQQKLKSRRVRKLCYI